MGAGSWNQGLELPSHLIGAGAALQDQRELALTRLEQKDPKGAERALDQFVIEGIAENIPFLGAVMEEAEFRKGDITTAYIKKHFPDGFKGAEPTAVAR